MGVFVTKLVKANITHSIYKNENFAVVPMANSGFEPFDNCRDVEWLSLWSSVSSAHERSHTTSSFSLRLRISFISFSLGFRISSISFSLGLQLSFMFYNVGLSDFRMPVYDFSHAHFGLFWKSEIWISIDLIMVQVRAILLSSQVKSWPESCVVVIRKITQSFIIVASKLLWVVHNCCPCSSHVVPKCFSYSSKWCQVVSKLSQVVTNVIHVVPKWSPGSHQVVVKVWVFFL